MGWGIILHCNGVQSSRDIEIGEKLCACIRVAGSGNYCFICSYLCSIEAWPGITFIQSVCAAGEASRRKYQEDIEELPSGRAGIWDQVAALSGEVIFSQPR